MIPHTHAAVDELFAYWTHVIHQLDHSTTNSFELFRDHPPFDHPPHHAFELEEEDEDIPDLVDFTPDVVEMEDGQ
ncbi:MAG: hypothetical protein P4L67_00910 [Candidatus Pacebacteria bacterium]|nr:hypothetical protein [Candidatus Paceibacterota bacterium]